MVFLLISDKVTHPAVTNSSQALRPITCIFQPHHKKWAICKRKSFEHSQITSFNFHQNTCLSNNSIIRVCKYICNIVEICLRGFSLACSNRKLFHQSFDLSANGVNEISKGWVLSICSKELYADTIKVAGPEIQKWVNNTGQIASFAVQSDKTTDNLASGKDIPNNSCIHWFDERKLFNDGPSGVIVCHKFLSHTYASQVDQVWV